MKEDLSGLVASGRMAVRRLRFVFLPPTGLYLSAQGNTLSPRPSRPWYPPLKTAGYFLPSLRDYCPGGAFDHSPVIYRWG